MYEKKEREDESAVMLPTIGGVGGGSGHRWFGGEDLRTGSVGWGRVGDGDVRRGGVAV
jgi:hypothetical protein